MHGNILHENPGIKTLFCSTFFHQKIPMEKLEQEITCPTLIESFESESGVTATKVE